MNDVRIRYNKGERKNTLVTIREGNVLYWGIARCNSHVGDRFNKAKGRFIALGRAKTEQSRYRQEFGNLYLEFSTHSSSLRGHCDMEDVHCLLKYFDNIDAFIFRGSNGVPLEAVLPNISEDLMLKMAGVNDPPADKCLERTYQPDLDEYVVTK